MTKEIALLLDYNDNFAKTIVDGVAKYSIQSDWRFKTHRGTPSITFEQLQHWHGDGVIGYLFPEAIELLSARNIPAVNVKTDFKEVPNCSVLTDNYKIGRMAADYFISKGYMRFLYTAGPIESEGAQLKYHGFEQRLSELNHRCQRLHNNFNRLSDIYHEDPTNTLAVLAAEDFVGRMVIEACTDQGLRIPDHVAVLGINNSPFICEMLNPEMSSIALGADRIGYQAAILLDQLMDGLAEPEKPIVIAPEGVIERHSTELVEINDPIVHKALNFIKANIHQPINVQQVAKGIGCSRRTIEKRFQSVLKRSPFEQIRRLRINKACELLRESDSRVEDISVSCGYNSRDRFNVAFKRQMNMTPANYRKQYRFAKHS